jgi:hypothetical protein
VLEGGREEVQKMFNKVLKRGYDSMLTIEMNFIYLVPDEIKDRMKTGVIGKQLEIDQKLSLREKAKAKRKAEDEEDRLFFEQTGIKDKSKDFTMENLVKKYQFDMERHEKKMRKIKALEKAGTPYDVDDVKLTDDEK